MGLIKRGSLVLLLCSIFSSYLCSSTAAEDQTPIPTFAPATMDEITLRLERVESSAETLGDVGSPRIDFEDHGWISREPVEEGLTGLPGGVHIEFYGLFQLSAPQLIARYESPEEVEKRLWGEYDLSLSVDSKVSFVNGQDEGGRQVFYFDTDNDEDLSDEEAVYAEEFVGNDSFQHRLLGLLVSSIPRGFQAEADVEFEYQEESQVRTARTPVQVFRYTRYAKRRKDPTFPKFRGTVPEYRKGQIDIGGDILELALFNKGRFATYQTTSFNRILWDLNGDGVFENESESAECYEGDESFNIGGIAMRVGRISPLGDEIVLRKVNAAVAPKRELTRGDLAPGFTVQDIDGNELSLPDLTGKYVLLDFWSTGCGPCIKDTPLLKAVHERFADDLIIIGISDDPEREPVERCVARNQVRWIQVLDRTDNDRQLKRLYNVSGWPKYYLIDREGRIAADSDLLRGVVESVLEMWLL